ncbi:MAG: hypothetical protein JWP97_2347 [Labilithrix sp.]|nr:hypothetical protein [Labilithrix sp.]
MKIRLVPAAAALALTLGGLAPPALAQTPTSRVSTNDYTEARSGSDQVVTFPGDELRGDENSAYGFTVRPAPGVLRAGLLRPRVNFVSELLKSVENL